MTTLIEVEHLSKEFKRHTAPAASLKERVLGAGRSEVVTFKALTDVSLTVKDGESIGLLGHNGSGKSTLLKCIAGTIRPTSGSVRVRGRLAAMLELGSGFHPDLTGRENVFLNASILGIPKSHVHKVFHEIVEFAELEDFIDEQVKHYSSGMYARLGFAVAVNLEPDVLLVDEVLSVGDETFQRKCLERVREFQTQGRSIVLVTHAPDQMTQLCDRAVVLEYGIPIFSGDANEAASVYRRALQERAQSMERERAERAAAEAAARGEVARPDHVPEVPVRPDVAIVSASAVNQDGSDQVEPGDTVTITMRYQADPDADVKRVRVRIIITSHDGVVLLNASTFDLVGDDVLRRPRGEGELRFTLRDLPLLDGTYRIGFVLQDPTETYQYDENFSATSFSVFSGGPSIGRVDFKPLVEHIGAEIAP